MLFGRQIPSGLINTKCLDCYDIAYLSESGLSKDREKFGLIGRIKYDYSKVRIGSDWPSHDFSGLMSAYKSGIEQRNKIPDDCKKSIFKQNVVLERYFPILMIK